jgi:hypothetical protein
LSWRTAAALVLAAASAAAQGVDRPEPGSREAIAAATTEPRFLSPWTADVPDHPTVPSPSDHLGHIAGAPGELTRTDRIYAYYRALDAASDRVSVEVAGRTEEGRDILLVLVGDAAAVAAADRIREDMAAIADPRRTDEAALERIVAATRPIYMLHGGLHSTETGSPEMLMELVYRLAVSESPLIRQIRDRVLVLVNPVAEPDGRDRAVDWFYRHLKGKTDFENLPPKSPPYWGKYVFHDNNRDGIQRKLALTRATQDAFLRWHPVVVHDLHESIPLLSIWTGTGPYNVHLDPSLTSEWHAIAFHEVATLTAMGLPGVWTWGFGEGWGHFYADSVAVNHNAIGRGYETFGNATAETVVRRLDPEDEKYAGVAVTEPEWYRTSPPPKGRFRWSLRNNVNYQQTGVLAALQYAALHGPDMMRNVWRRAGNAVRKGTREAPYAVAIRPRHDDPRRLERMLELLLAHGIEVSRATAAFSVREGRFPAGTYLVRTDQPYRGYALDLLTPQKFPADKTPYEPYDDVAWDLPSTLGVAVTRIADASVRNVAATRIDAAPRYRGTVTGSGPAYLLKDVGQESLLAARVRLALFDVQVAERAFASGGVEYPAGSWIVRGEAAARDALAAAAGELGLDFASAPVPDVPRHAADWPKLAVLQTWSDTQSAGWMRMAFDERRVPYALIMDGDVRAGGLRARFDVIVMPNSDEGLKTLVNGIDPKFSPLAYTPTPEFPTHGQPTSSPDITGGLTWAGVGNLEQFVREGGLLVTLGGASTLPLDGGIARDVSRARTKTLFTPGSELRARFRRTDHPIAYGYPEQTSAFRENRPLYAVRKVDEGRVVLQWGAELPKPDDEDDAETGDEEPAPEASDRNPGAESNAPEKAARPATPSGDGKDDDDEDDDDKDEEIVVSGGIKGASEIAGKPAILDLPTGRGRIVAFDFDPIHRYLTLSDFRLLWNVILNWNDLGGRSQ